jgi:hypothetical protein
LRACTRVSASPERTQCGADTCPACDDCIAPSGTVRPEVGGLTASAHGTPRPRTD